MTAERLGPARRDRKSRARLHGNAGGLAGSAATLPLGYAAAVWRLLRGRFSRAGHIGKILISRAPVRVYSSPMRYCAPKLDRMIERAQAARTKTIAVGVRAWGWLRTRARKSGPIRATLHRATGTARNVLGGRIVRANRKLCGLLGYRKGQTRQRAGQDSPGMAQPAQTLVRRDFDAAIARATAEMMARVHAEQQAIQRKSHVSGGHPRWNAEAEPAPALPDAVMEFIAYVPGTRIQHPPTQSPRGPAENRVRRMPAGAKAHGVLDTRPLAATRPWRQGGARYLAQGGLCYATRARNTDPQCASPDRSAGTGDYEAREFPLQWQQRHHPDSSPRVLKDRAVNGRHSPRKSRASRR